MQWLIDLIIEAIGVPPCYIDRGAFGPNDFTQADLIQDGTWRELDFSAIVPDGATAINLHWTAQDAAIGKILYIRPAGDTTTIGTCMIRSQVANLGYGAYTPMSISADRKVEYRCAAPGYTILTFKIRGWWL